MEINRVYAVWSDNGGFACKTFSTYAEAAREAEKTARLRPMAEVHILATADVRMTQVHWINDCKIVEDTQ